MHRTIRVFVAVAALTAAAASAQVPAIDPDSDRPWLAVTEEVMKACKETSLQKVYLDTPREFKTLPDLVAYRDSRELFARLAGKSSKCWTFDRWRRYVEARVPFTSRLILAADDAWH